MWSLISFNISNTFWNISLIIGYSYHIIKQMISFINIEIRIFYIIHIILESISRHISPISRNKSSGRFCGPETNFIIRTMNFGLIMQEKFLKWIIPINSWILCSFCSIESGMIFMISFFEVIIYRRRSAWKWILLFFSFSVIVIIYSFPIWKCCSSW